MKPDFIGGEGLDPIDLTSPEPEPETFSYSHHLIITGWCTKGKAESLEARIDNNTQIETRIQKIRAEKDKDDVLIVFDGNIDSVEDNKLFAPDGILRLERMAFTFIYEKDGKKESFAQLLSSGKIEGIQNLNKKLADIAKDFNYDKNHTGFDQICEEIIANRKKYKEGKLTKQASFFKIQNVSSSKDIPQEVIELMKDIIQEGRYPFMTKFEYLLPCHPNDPLLIPIFLKKPEDMPTYEELWKEVKGADKEKYIPNTTVLGYYCQDDKEPHIVLCPENIESCADNNTTIPVLYTIVLVHEYAHALLDKHFEFSLYHDYFANWDMDDVKNLPNSLSAKAMEESLANMIVLKWLKSFDDCKFEQAKIFIENKQPAIYKFGIHQYEAGVDWKKWRESNKQSSQKLEKWFNHFFSNGEIKKPIFDTKDIYDSVFK